jgi:uncharacterized protein (TIGR03083 family)
MPQPVAVLRTSHDRLAGLVAGISEETANRISYCSDWTIAQVLSHIGSGAEIGRAWLTAAIEHTEPIGQDELKLIWDKWNKRAPLEQVTEAIAADAALVEAYEAATDQQLADAHIKLFGVLDLDGFGMAKFRLPEAAVHTWDVEVTLDPAARILPSAVELIIDALAFGLPWTSKPQGRAWSITVETTGPSRTFTLTSGDAVSLTEGAAPDGDGVLRLPAEAFLRLTYGRLDEGNADGAELTGSVTLAELRATFPGF